MYIQVSKIFLILIILSLSNFAEGDGKKNPLQRFFDMVKKMLKLREKTKNNSFDDSVVYAIPSPDGHGFILHGYGKPHDPYAYDNDVDINQRHKMWVGNVKIPNMFPSDDYSSKKERVVKGFDNRFGFRIAVPFLGDFQYLREIGPGRFTDNLGPGDFPYPGYKDKKSYHGNHHDPYGHAYGHGNYGPYGDLYGTNGLPYGHPDDGPVSDHAENYHVAENHVGHHYSGSEIKEVYSEGPSENHPSEHKEDLLEGMRNYPWNKRR